MSSAMTAEAIMMRDSENMVVTFDLPRLTTAVDLLRRPAIADQRARSYEFTSGAKAVTRRWADAAKPQGAENHIKDRAVASHQHRHGPARHASGAVLSVSNTSAVRTRQFLASSITSQQYRTGPRRTNELATVP